MWVVSAYPCQSLTYRQLADLVLVLHFALVVWVVLGLLLTVLGNLVRWYWVNTRWFRAAHLLAITIVVAESWFGLTCPLTTLENWSRAHVSESACRAGFIEHWVSQMLFFNAPAWVLTAAYSVFGLLVALAWWKYPPR